MSLLHPREFWPMLRRRWILLLLGLLLPVIGFAGVVMWRSAVSELEVEFDPDAGHISMPTDPEFFTLQLVNLALPGDPPLTAFYQISHNQRIILLLHGTGANRSQLLPEARILARYGYGFISLDWPGHGGSAGEILWGEPERKALRRILDWIQSQPDTQDDVIGVLGFSMGSWISLQVAEHDLRIKALCLTGAFADAEDLLAFQSGHWGWLSAWPALLVDRWKDLRYWENRSSDIIPHIAPRPVLLVAGSADRSVPEVMSRKLFAAAQEPKHYLLIEGADHGAYATTNPLLYERNLIEFFDKALPPKSAK